MPWPRPARSCRRCSRRRYCRYRGVKERRGWNSRQTNSKKETDRQRWTRMDDFINLLLFSSRSPLPSSSSFPDLFCRLFKFLFVCLFAGGLLFVWDFLGLFFSWSCVVLFSCYVLLFAPLLYLLFSQLSSSLISNCHIHTTYTPPPTFVFYLFHFHSHTSPTLYPIRSDNVLFLHI